MKNNTHINLFRKAFLISLFTISWIFSWGQAGSIFTLESKICAGQPVRFMYNGGCNVYWNVQGATVSPLWGSSTYVTFNSPAENVRVEAICQSNQNASAYIYVNVNPTTAPSVSISGPSSPICKSGGVLTLSASPANQGYSPSYNWYIDNNYVGATSSPNFSKSVSDLAAGNHTAYVKLVTQNCVPNPEATSSAINFTVQPLATYNVTLYQPEPVCTDTYPSVSSFVSQTLPQDVYNSLTYTWYVYGGERANSPGTPSHIFNPKPPSGQALGNENPVYVVVKSNAFCTQSSATSNTVYTYTTQMLPVSASINAIPMNTVVCSGETVTFGASLSGGSGGTYQWSTGQTGATATRIVAENLSETGKYRPGDPISVTINNIDGCVQTKTASATGSTSLIGMKPIITPTGPTEFCDGGNVKLTASVPAGAAPSSYEWYKNSVVIPGANSAIYFATATGSYQAKALFGICNKMSSAINVSVIEKVPVTATINIQNMESAPFCSGQAIVFEAILSAGTSEDYLWDPGEVGSIMNLPVAENMTEEGRYKPGDVVSVTISNIIGCVQQTTVTASISTTQIGMRPSISSGASSILCAGQPLTLTASVPSGVAPTSYEWYNGSTLISGVTGSQYPATTEGSYSVKALYGTCSTTSAASFQPIEKPLPVTGILKLSASDVDTGIPVTVSTLSGVGAPQYWCSSNGGQTWNIYEQAHNAQTSYTDTHEVAGEYLYMLKNKNECGYSAPVYQQLNVGKLINIVREDHIRVNNIKTLEAVAQLDVTKKSVHATYVDGLGRPLQETDWQASPNAKDIVQPIYYDQYGRVSREYLPATVPQGTAAYHATLLDGNGNYTVNTYNNASDNVVDDAKPHSEIIFEASPLNRPVKQYGVGEAWSATQDNKFTAYQYLTNVHGESAGQEKIIAWKVTESGIPEPKTALANFVEAGGYYSSHQLSIVSTKDEQGFEKREYTDKQGHVVLRKVQAIPNTTDLNNPDHWAQTYYIYDEFGNLVLVLPPQGVKQLLDTVANGQ
jgi:hypothetical protein